VAAVLGLPDAQLLQIDTPAVKPEEMKSAARWRIKDLVDARLDELTIDVMHVGDAQARSANRQLFVVAARNALIQGLSRRLQSSGLTLSVIDVAETVQRNLLCAAADAAGLNGRATAALVRHGDQALLTICAQGELYYARRLDWDDNGLRPANPAPAELADAMDMAGLDFVDYGAADAAIDDVGAPRLVVEVQRSFDLWERSWPDLPLAGVWVHAGDATDLLIAQLAPALVVPVQALAPEALFPGYAEATTSPALRHATLPLLGALRRFTASD
jgi:MSHA biogenesis protein MshI